MRTLRELDWVDYFVTHLLDRGLAKPSADGWVYIEITDGDRLEYPELRGARQIRLKKKNQWCTIYETTSTSFLV